MAIVQRKSASEQIIDYVLGEIEKGNLKPGEKMMCERDFAELLGVSRVPLREAICALSALGIVESKQGGGTFVNKFNVGTFGRLMYIYTILDDISARDLLEVRGYLESAVAMLAAKRRNEENIKAIKEAAQDFREKSESFSEGRIGEVEVFQADNEFHYQIALGSGNRLLVEFLEAVRKPVHKQFDKGKDRQVLINAFSASVEFHEKILEAIEKGLEMESYQIMLEHVTDIASAIEDVFANRTQSIE